MGEQVNKFMIDEPDDEIKILTRELRAAERNVEVLANLCSYLSGQVSEYTRSFILNTLHRIEYLRAYQMDEEFPVRGVRWAYERPLIWRDRARYEDTLHRLETELKEQKPIGISS